MPLVRGLRVALLLAMATLVGGILISLISNIRVGPRASAAEPLEPGAPSTGVAQHASNVQMVRSRRGVTTLQLRARESTTYTNGRLELADPVFRLIGTDGSATLVESPAAEMIPGPAVAARAGAQPPGARDVDQGSWLLSGGARIAAANGLTLASPNLRYEEADGEASTEDPVAFNRGTATGSAVGMRYDVERQVVHFPEKVQAEMPLGGMGLVKIDARSADHDLAGMTFEMHGYRALTQRGETLSGGTLVAYFREGSGITRLEGDDGFVLESSQAVSTGGGPSPLARLLALEGTRTMRGQRLAMLFDESQQPVSLEVSGEANLMASQLEKSGGPASIAAQTLQFEIRNGNLSRARAVGGVDLKGAPAEGQSTGFRLKSDDLEAILDPNLGSLQDLQGTGDIQLTDQGLESQGNSTRLDPNSDIVTLTGKEGRPATATWLGRKIQAQRIEADRRGKTLSARDGVRASYLPEAPASASTKDKEGQTLPFFRTGETIHAMAGSLTFADEGKLAKYRDHVRIWQGDNRIEASEVDLNEATGTLEARRDVISTFRQQSTAAARPPPAPSTPSDDIVTVSASAMTYDQTAGTILYAGHVLMTQGGTRITGEKMLVTLDTERRSATLVETTDKVEVRDGGRVGHGDKLVADLKANTLKLSGSGREASVQDETGQQFVRGSSLTIDRTGDRILVESEQGGRTWITLKPRQKGAPVVGADPRN